jgi:hypothetical protein
MASGTIMMGTVIANNAAINMNTGVVLEGRALSTAGAVTVDGVLAYTPIGCGSPIPTGPAAPALATSACYALFSSDGPVTNTGLTYVTGDVGTNTGLTTGYDPLLVVGTVHPIPDISTAQCAIDLLNVYTNLNALPYDIELLYPAQFGNDLVLTPHTYLLNAATDLTGTLYLNAYDNTNAVFVIQINGALSTGAYSKVLLSNGAQAKNVYWKIEGAVTINDYSGFSGTIVCNNGAISLNTGVALDGRALTTTGILTTNAINAVATMIPSNCGTLGVPVLDVANADEVVTIYPNPFMKSINILINDGSQINKGELKIYNVLGEEVINSTLTKQLTILETGMLSSGIYFYKVIENEKTIQSGRLISQ